jgi:N-hydroxyarylamine O-acetyltransferase
VSAARPLTPVDVDELLAHVGLAGRPAPDAAGLRAVHRAYVGRVPYEDLAIQLGEVGPLDPRRIAARVLAGGRGGYCFEVNGLLAVLLEALGFGVERREARVGPRTGGGPVNHLALVVRTADGQPWLAEAGYGEGWVDPLPLRAGRHEQGPLHWTLAGPDDDGRWWVAQHGWGSTEGMLVDGPTVGLDAFAPHHERLSTAPDSPFVQTLVVESPRPDHVRTLRARTLSARGPHRDERHTLATRAELASVLRDEFGIDPAVLGPDRLERLWTRACEQHDRWAAARA